MSDIRKATIKRDTTETQIEVTLNLDGTGVCSMTTGIPFFEHMLTQIARHGLIDIDIQAHGDLQIDAHHTVEDVGIVMGQAFARALGDKTGIYRYGHAYVPLDEALSRVVVTYLAARGCFMRCPTRAVVLVTLMSTYFVNFFKAL